MFPTHLDVEVFRLCQQKVGNGAPLHASFLEGGTACLDANLPQISLQSNGGEN